MVEACALYLSVRLLAECCFTQVVFESDCNNLIRKLNDQRYNSRCLQKEETINHAFMECQRAAKPWFGSRLGIRFDNNHKNFIDWLAHSINNLNNEDLSYVASITYGIWYARNCQVFENRDIDDKVINGKALENILEYQKNISIEQAISRGVSTNNHVPHPTATLPITGKNPIKALLKVISMLTSQLKDDGAWVPSFKMTKAKSWPLRLGRYLVITIQKRQRRVRFTTRSG
ncbi:hypothetical protein L195_g032801 [Trifolium pratense]|uniref:RNase H type-1 domain-containing protein n=1 Tax=Trifolium pratense TaxID=57577 RepID=A0A2K3LE90_TRIPR|nr:hypothetical protein L195_g032801 [Trifolium pratense]